MSHLRTEQLRQLIQLLEEICKEIMWVNEKEEEELVFDWGDKNVENYIPKKQESYSVSEHINSDFFVLVLKSLNLID